MLPGWRCQRFLVHLLSSDESSLQAMGDASPALPLFRLALENCERVLSKEHPHTFKIRKNDAKCRQVLSQSGHSGWWQSALFRGLVLSVQITRWPNHSSGIGSLPRKSSTG